MDAIGGSVWPFSQFRTVQALKSSRSAACYWVILNSSRHLELSLAEPQQWRERIRHAGAVFLGRYSSEALGEYCAGPNHVLPTSQTARMRIE